MHAFARTSLLAGLLCAGSEPAWAETHGVNLPTAPRGSGGEDMIETATGTRCRQSMNSNGAYLDVGAVGVASEPLDNDVGDGFRFYSNDRDKTGLVYMRLTVPLGKKPERIDCSQVYELEIARLRAELELMRMAAE